MLIAPSPLVSALVLSVPKNWVMSVRPRMFTTPSWYRFQWIPSAEYPKRRLAINATAIWIKRDFELLR